MGSHADDLGEGVRDVSKEMAIMKRLQCPLCMDVALPPIYTCTEGHIICSECLPKLQRCATCQNSFSNARNYSLESIFTTSSFTCKFRTDGCKQICKGSELVIHLRKCEYRPIECQYRNCTERIPAASYMNHLKNVHNTFGFDKEQESYQFKNTNDFVISDEDIDMGFFYAFYDDHYFLVNLVIRDRTAYQSVCLIGPEAAALNYEAILSFQNPVGKAPEIQWKIPVQSFRQEPFNWNICVAIPVQQLKFFMTNDTITDASNGGHTRTYKFAWSTTCKIRKIPDNLCTNL